MPRTRGASSHEKAGQIVLFHRKKTVTAWDACAAFLYYILIVSLKDGQATGAPEDHFYYLTIFRLSGLELPEGTSYASALLSSPCSCNNVTLNIFLPFSVPAVICPPCWLMIASAMARPRPEPSESKSPASSSLTKCPKICPLPALWDGVPLVGKKYLDRPWPMVSPILFLILRT